MNPFLGAADNKLQRGGIRADDDREEGPLVAVTVEVLKVECVVRYLVKRLARVVGFADFVLDDKNVAFYEQHCINALAHARDHVLKRNGARWMLASDNLKRA